MPEQRLNTFPILLAGGTGTRLWPVSRKHHPKQLVKFIENESLVQGTVKRLIPVLGVERIRIVCGEEHAHEIARHTAEIGVHTADKIITEPCARNTAPAILLAVLTIMKTEKDAVLCVFPADHTVRDTRRFHQKLKSAITLAQAGHVVAFGIMPKYPETGYGYIEGAGEVDEGALHIKRFVEKPNLETARTYLADGNFFWNSGMFAFRASVMIEEFKKLQPDLLEQMGKLLQTEDSVSREGYEQLQKISIDYAIMEKTAKGIVLPSDFGWSDIGTWKSLYDFLPKDKNNNVIAGNIIAKHTENCLLMGYERLIAANRLKNTVVVETPDAVFVSDMDHSRDVNSFVEILEAQGRHEHRHHKTVYQPWGSYTLLEQKEGLKVARIMIYPGAVYDRPHVSKAMHLIAIQGEAKITIATHGRRLEKGESTTISNTDAATIENPGTDPIELVQVEVDA
ncbi:MAG: mannose-1-phosphate guanylyltransferase/mannose-6-phosphate isomerase [Deltaproteobacteria bacterium]|nr:mannose-1-phosphate guanylyltransferase/mannose-6-phosphate isomerase [Deltaproteobacteria bacterium]